MSLATSSDIASVNGVSSAIATTASARLYEAEHTIRQWIGDGKYEDMVSAGSASAYLAAENNRTYADTEYTHTVRAEAMLAYAYAMPHLNMRLTEKGGYVKNLGLDQMGNANILMGKSELNSYVREVVSRAKLLMREMIYHGEMSEEDRVGALYVL